jgi:hypothetical protein
MSTIPTTAHSSEEETNWISSDCNDDEEEEDSWNDLSDASAASTESNSEADDIKPDERTSAEEPQTMEESYALLAKEMNKLSMQEREEVLQDIHGVADIPNETPEFVEACLTEMERTIQEILAPSSWWSSNTQVSAYEQARNINPSYVHDTKLRLMFLRSDGFHAKDAALRMIHFFEEKLVLFGPDKLTRNIVLHDMNADDRKSLESGFFQILPNRDRAGRAIICGSPMLRNTKNDDNLVRLEFGSS